jgi:hypothetical protein
LFDVGLGLLLLAGDVSLGGLGGDQDVVEVTEPVVDLLGLGQLREGAALVRELGQALVDGLQVQQAELGGGVGVQGGPRYLGGAMDMSMMSEHARQVQ